MKKSSMNLPNTLSLLRCALVPVFVVTLFLMREIPLWGRIVPAIVYLITGLTDMLDGKIARKYNLVTDFGKFIDPLADKFMVLGSLIAILTLILIEGETVMGLVFCAVVLILLLRELGVTSLRLVVAGKSGIVVAASMFGKLKTVSQMAGTLVILLEPVVFPFCAQNHIASYIAMAIMAVTTVASGLDYLKAYMPYIDSNS
ncbi:MAG: CDP-diacylglycerol--glycerol-3-phosphate 3-phosphatidyltransferase [Clostridia bacterium]|nr:CDP-diacylglycerol--glycerol-3-phosphate 3-phosphatidyltransferase [Clostridia bacterium]